MKQRDATLERAFPQVLEIAPFGHALMQEPQRMQSMLFGVSNVRMSMPQAR
jgi:hypothetical protein